MKRSIYFALITVCSLAFSSLAVAGPKEKPAGSKDTKQTQPLDQPKITKKEAEHTVLFMNKGGSIEKCELIMGPDGHSNWLVSVLRSGALTASDVQIDGITGKVVPPPDKKK